jgi:hypothetical protein
VYSFAISQRALERIGLSLAGLLLLGGFSVLSVLFFLQVISYSRVIINNLSSPTALHLQRELQLLPPACAARGTGDLPTILLHIQVSSFKS